MTNETINNDAPALGCLVGTAFQKMQSDLLDELNKIGLDINVSEYMVLRALYRTDGIQQCDIARMVGKDKAAVSRCVACLEKKGLVTTQAVSHKCIRVYLTEKSHGIKSLIMDVAKKRHRSLCDIATPLELEIFTKVLNNIVKQK